MNINTRHNVVSVLFCYNFIIFCPTLITFVWPTSRIWLSHALCTVQVWDLAISYLFYKATQQLMSVPLPSILWEILVRMNVHVTPWSFWSCLNNILVHKALMDFIANSYVLFKKLTWSQFATYFVSNRGLIIFATFFDQPPKSMCTL